MKPMSIVPVEHLSLIKDDTHFMALLHLVRASEEYREFFRARADEGKFVLLDDSAIECPGLADVYTLIESALAIRTSEVMLLDKLRDEEITLTNSRATLVGIQQRFGSKPPFRIMAVPQGQTEAEWLHCAGVMASWPEVDTIGVSYTTTTYFKSGCRTGVIQALLSSGVIPKALHLLGCFDIEEAKETARHFPSIRSIDSAIATVFAQHGALLGDGFQRSRDLRARVIDFETCHLTESVLARNLQLWRGQILNTEYLRTY